MRTGTGCAHGRPSTQYSEQTILSHAARGLDFTEHAVLEPLRAPPVHRRDLLAAHEHREMQVIATGEAGHAAAPDLLSLLHHVADLDENRREVSVERLDTEAVIDHDAVPVDAEVCRVHDAAAL